MKKIRLPIDDKPVKMKGVSVMDCPKAETAMMSYVEKTIKPEDARDLAIHVLRCEPCRELYLMMDVAAEVSESPLTEAPAGFTERVVERIQADGVTLATATPKTVPTQGNTLLRVLWGLSGIVTGVALLLALNPEWRMAVLLRDGFSAFAVYFGETMTWLTQTDITDILINSGLGLLAFVFAGLIAALLYGLHRGENTLHETRA
jgi:hypothetical protein